MRNFPPSLPRLLRSAPTALLATPPKCTQPSLEPARTYSSPLGRCLPRGGPNYPSPLRFRWNLPPLLLFRVASSFFCSTHHWLMDHSSRTHLAYAVCCLLSHAILNTRISCASLAGFVSRRLAASLAQWRPEGKPGGESRFPLSLKTDGVLNTKLFHRP